MLIKYSIILYLFILTIKCATYTKVLQCYFCGVRKRGTQNWINFANQTCVPQIVSCTRNNIACVSAKVFGPEIEFTISGCSEDFLSGCETRVLIDGVAKLERCQCHQNLCNRDSLVKSKSKMLDEQIHNSLTSESEDGLIVAHQGEANAPLSNNEDGIIGGDVNNFEQPNSISSKAIFDMISIVSLSLVLYINN